MRCGDFVAESSTSFSEDGLIICKKCEAKQTINTGDSRAAIAIAGMGYGVLATGFLSLFCNVYMVVSVLTWLGAIAYFGMVWRHPESRARMGRQFITATGAAVVGMLLALVNPGVLLLGILATLLGR